MKQLITLLLLLATAPATSARDRKPKQVNIPGTHVFISPPPGYVVASNFTGLHNGKNVIQVVEARQAFKAADDFNREDMERKGARIIDFRDTTFEGYPACFVLMQGNPKIRTEILVFGDSSFTLMAMGMFPPDDDSTEAAIRKSMFSISYNKKFKVDYLAAARFTLDDSRSRLKFSTYSGSLYLYTNGGVPQQDPDSPLVMINVIPFDSTTMTATSVGKSMVTSLEATGFTGTEYAYESAEPMNGYKSYEAEVYGRQNGKRCLLYIFVSIKNATIVRFEGKATSHFEANVMEFKALVRTMKHK